MIQVRHIVISQHDHLLARIDMLFQMPKEFLQKLLLKQVAVFAGGTVRKINIVDPKIFEPRDDESSFRVIF